MSTAPLVHWNYLAPKPRSQYRQLFVKDRNIAAWTLYSMSVAGEEPAMTTAAIAADFDLPVEAVAEAIQYCRSNPPEILQDWQADEALAAAMGINARPGTSAPKLLSPSEMARIRAL